MILKAAADSGQECGHSLCLLRAGAGPRGSGRIFVVHSALDHAFWIVCVVVHRQICHLEAISIEVPCQSQPYPVQLARARPARRRGAGEVRDLAGGPMRVWQERA